MFAPALAAPSLSPAEQILAGAETQALAQHKAIFFIFGASWCGPCHRLDAFLAAPEIRPIVEKHFIVAKVNIQERFGKHPELDTPGGSELAAKYGNTDGVPFIVFLDASGAPIVTSNRNGSPKDNIGYPDSPEEIDWFMVMLKKSVPELAADEAHTVEAWLRKTSRK